jgi:hypothetical protein
MPTSMQNQGSRSPVAFALAGVIIVCSAAAFLVGDHRAAGIIAGQACIALCLAYTAAKRSKKTM